LSDFNFFSDASSSSEEDVKPKSKKGDFTSSDVSDNLSPESLSLRVTELESALCKQDKLLCKVFRENNMLNLELKNASSEIASFRPVYDDMSAKPCDNYKMIIVNYADLWLVHSHIASLLDSAKLELRGFKVHSKLLGDCTSCSLLKSDLEACAVEIKDLKYQITHFSLQYCISSVRCV
jgi:hypothetical protein